MQNTAEWLDEQRWAGLPESTNRLHAFADEIEKFPRAETGLTKNHARALRALAAAYETLLAFREKHGGTAVPPPTQRRAHEQALQRIVRLGLGEFPLLKSMATEVVAVMTALGQREWLRGARQGLETGVRRPRTVEETEIASAINTAIRDQYLAGARARHGRHDAKRRHDCYVCRRLAEIDALDPPAPEREALVAQLILDTDDRSVSDARRGHPRINWTEIKRQVEALSFETPFQHPLLPPKSLRNFTKWVGRNLAGFLIALPPSATR